MLLLQGSMVMSYSTLDTNTNLGIALMEGPSGARLVNVSMDREGPTGYHTGACIKTLPVERLISMFPSSEGYLYQYCGTTEHTL